MVVELYIRYIYCGRVGGIVCGSNTAEVSVLAPWCCRAVAATAVMLP